MSEPEPRVIERIAEYLRRPVPIDPSLDARIMARIAAAPAPRRGGVPAWWTWLTAPSLRLSPLAAAAAGAAVVAAVLLARSAGREREPGVTGAAPVQFVLIAPTASSVALVGDFNDWNPERTPLHQVHAGGVWAVTVPLAAGRYRYAFVVDARQWVPDPRAPRALDEDFGVPNSVVTVAGGPFS